jgi:D-glycero-D-manno-heptose 1,7-bisphosphate phosphatase
MSEHRALFLDRDGVINVDYGYVTSEKEFEFVEGIFDLCREAQRLRYLVVVVTNQSAIGRGFITEEGFMELTEWMCASFRSEGVEIKKVYFSPCHPEYGLASYKQDSFFRKPAPGMIQRARDELSVDLSQSVLIGDKESDMQAGASAGVGCNLLFSGSVEKTSSPTVASAVISKLTDALPYLWRTQ